MIVLVTGATGLQGGAVARHLLAAGHHVRALVRKPSAALAQAGAEPVLGDMDDRASLVRAMRGAQGVFSVQPTESYPGAPAGFTTDDEVRLGLNVAEAAKEAGVGHVVYSSVGGAERSPGIRRWESKWRIERHIGALALPATILRPVRFMENHSGPHLDVLSDVFHADTPVQLIAADDIGAFAALAFADPDHYVGRAIELAGDELTMPQIAAAISRATGRTITYRPIPRQALTGDGVAGYDFGNDRGWQADLPMLRRLHPGLMDFATWLAALSSVGLDETPAESVDEAPNTRGIAGVTL
ncbi:NmrA/HSCARG family protein [Nonomuraea sp. NPDC050556]|uniref:NmrA/HSCARG family protein n=1 Tax=Nonomuraea sp. NPDC050556 TaxID=3364369 RepID=UPI0037B9DFA0